jgi:adenylate cyclase, class 2
MKRTIIEIKAKCSGQSNARKVLQEHSAVFKGVDHQVDTYFNVTEGRLKLREGKIENFLIHYNREDQQGPKRSDVLLYKSEPGSSLKNILIKALGVLTVVDKTREIYFINNVKFHLDNIEGLGSFIEIEAIGTDGSIDPEQLQSQCRYYMELLNISDNDLISRSYSDLMMHLID